jgi:curved DNA-binding protein CbpA
MSKDLYKILGIEPTATQEQIKKAYYKLAIKYHPDKGGTDEQMSDIAYAYNILSNIEKRKLYDKTGLDNIKPIDIEVRTLLLESFSRALQKDASDCLQAVNKLLRERMEQLEQEIYNAKKEKDKLISKRSKIIVKEGDNCFQMVIDQALVVIESNIERIENMKRVFDLAIKRLKDYKSLDKQTENVKINKIRYNLSFINDIDS